MQRNSFVRPLSKMLKNFQCGADTSSKKTWYKTSKNIQMATKIIIQGDIGTVGYVKGNEIGIILDKGVEASDIDWEVLAKPSETIKMTVENGSNVSKGDLAVIENENLCIKRTKESLNCEFILCRSE